jgi:hypothetical protein
VQGVELGAHLLAELCDERAWVERLAEAGVVLGAAGLEVGGQVLIRVAPPAAPVIQISLQRRCSRSAWKVTTS